MALYGLVQSDRQAVEQHTNKLRLSVTTALHCDTVRQISLLEYVVCKVEI